MQENPVTPAFKLMNTLYLAFGAGMLIMTGVFYFIRISDEMPPDPSLVSAFQIVVPVLGISSFIIGKYFYGVQAKKSREEPDINKKLALFRTALLMVWAFLEGAAMFASVCFFMTGDTLFLAFFAMIFLGFLFNKPAISKFQQEF